MQLLDRFSILGHNKTEVEDNKAVGRHWEVGSLKI